MTLHTDKGKERIHALASQLMHEVSLYEAAHGRNYDTLCDILVAIASVHATLVRSGNDD